MDAVEGLMPESGTSRACRACRVCRKVDGSETSKQGKAGTRLHCALLPCIDVLWGSGGSKVEPKVESTSTYLVSYLWPLFASAMLQQHQSVSIANRKPWIKLRLYLGLNVIVCRPGIGWGFWGNSPGMRSPPFCPAILLSSGSPLVAHSSPPSEQMQQAR